MRCILLLFAVIAILMPQTARADDEPKSPESRPNILFCIADDWGWPHAGAYGDAGVKTPTFDRLAKEGVLFEHAYVSSPSCTPCRNALLTGQWHWRLDTGANLWSQLPVGLPVYPLLLEDAGYRVGTSGKSYGPGRLEGWQRFPAGKKFRNFQEFLKDQPADQPFCYWLGSSDPHRPYKLNSGNQSGIDLAKVHLFPHYPDDEVVRGDIADYYFEVQRFDGLIGSAVAAVEAAGKLDATIIVMTGDHGMPFPRCKGNLYDSGVRVPLAVRWGNAIPAGRRVTDMVSFTDIGPTFLSTAGVAVPDVMTGRNLLPILLSEKAGRVNPEYGTIFFGKERHCPAQVANNPGGYPSRAIRTDNYLYIRNFDPERWPAGTPDYKNARMNSWIGDCDGSPTKRYIVANRELDDEHGRSYDLCFGQRPGEELFDLKKDPDQLVNVANQPEYAGVKAKLAAQLMAKLKETGDPRAIGGGEKFDTYPYYGGAPRYPGDAAIEAYRKKSS